MSLSTFNPLCQITSVLMFENPMMSMHRSHPIGCDSEPSLKRCQSLTLELLSLVYTRHALAILRILAVVRLKYCIFQVLVSGRDSVLMVLNNLHCQRLPNMSRASWQLPQEYLQVVPEKCHGRECKASVNISMTSRSRHFLQFMFNKTSNPSC